MAAAVEEEAFHVLFHIQFNCDWRQGADSNFSTHKKEKTRVRSTGRCCVRRFAIRMMVENEKTRWRRRTRFPFTRKILLRYCDTNWTSTYLICSTFLSLGSHDASFWIFDRAKSETLIRLSFAFRLMRVVKFYHFCLIKRHNRWAEGSRLSTAQ